MNKLTCWENQLIIQILEIWVFFPPTVHAASLIHRVNLKSWRRPMGLSNWGILIGSVDYLMLSFLCWQMVEASQSKVIAHSLASTLFVFLACFLRSHISWLFFQEKNRIYVVYFSHVNCVVSKMMIIKTWQPGLQEKIDAFLVAV